MFKLGFIEKSKATLKYTLAITTVESQGYCWASAIYLNHLPPNKTPLCNSSLGEAIAKWVSLFLGITNIFNKERKSRLTHSFQNHKE